MARKKPKPEPEPEARPDPVLPNLQDLLRPEAQADLAAEAQRFYDAHRQSPVPGGQAAADLADFLNAAAGQAQETRQRNYFGDSMTPAAAEKLRKAVLERARRQVEALKLYEPLNAQLQFHMSNARIRLARGSNRSGKTLAAAVEVARAATGQCPQERRYPLTDGRAFLVGKDQRHCGAVMGRKLLRAGAFKIIRDEVTGAWRAFRPWRSEDRARESEARAAPPLIPRRFIRQIAWENKAESIPAVVTLHNGWELNFYSSLGKPPQGSDLDLAWMDEEIVDEDWVPEMSARLLDRKGKLLWSATPQAGTDQLYDLHEKAEEERKKSKPDIEEFLILLDDNPHIGDEEKRLFVEGLSEEERKVRHGGDFALLSYKVYPEFSMHLHGVDYQDIPHNWCRYMVVDPGHRVCACLFAAVPPPEVGDFIYLYDELYLRESNAATFALNVSYKAANQKFQGFIIDPNAAVYTDMATGKSVGQQYSEALAERKIFSVATGNNFILAGDNIDAGTLAVRNLLRRRDNNTPPKLRVLRGVLPNFEWEIKRYHMLRVKGVITDKPDQKKNNHLVDTLRYLAMCNPRYITPPVKSGPLRGSLASYRAKMERKRQQDGPDYVRLGPGSGKRDMGA